MCLCIIIGNYFFIIILQTTLVKVFYLLNNFLMKKHWKFLFFTKSLLLACIAWSHPKVIWASSVQLTKSYNSCPGHILYMLWKKIASLWTHNTYLPLFSKKNSISAMGRFPPSNLVTFDVSFYMMLFYLDT